MYVLPECSFRPDSFDSSFQFLIFLSIKPCKFLGLLAGLIKYSYIMDSKPVLVVVLHCEYELSFDNWSQHPVKHAG